jgi:hypothetical protein
MALAPLVALRPPVDLRGPDFDQVHCSAATSVNPGEVLQKATLRDSVVKGYFVENC